jgi:hypothetical protein
VRTLDHWKKYQPALKKQMQAALQKVAAAKGLSKDVQEVVGRTLGSGSLGTGTLGSGTLGSGTLG